MAARIRASDELRTLVAATPAEGLPEVLGSTAIGEDLLAAFARYLERYGHQIYNPRTAAYVALVVGAVIGVAGWWRNRRQG